MKASIYVAGRYSMRRKVAGTHGQPTPIISFRTQQLPILYTLAQVFVVEAFSKDAAERLLPVAWILEFVMELRRYSRRLWSIMFEAVFSRRCRAQGLFKENQIIASQVRTESDVAYLSPH
jgi:acyl-CoA oxidase